MKNPFCLDRPNILIARERIRNLIAEYIKWGRSVLLASPRGWGKSTLARMTAAHTKSEHQIVPCIYNESQVAGMLQERPFQNHYFTQSEGLREHQKRTLKAIGYGCGQPYSEESIEDFGLRSKGHVARSVSCLIRKKIIVRQAGIHSFSDPIYMDWFMKDFML